MKELPEGLPPLPEGAVYLGQGDTFHLPTAQPITLFHGWGYLETDGSWQSSEWTGQNERLHYAAPADSEIARLNGLGGTNSREALRKFHIAWANSYKWNELGVNFSFNPPGLVIPPDISEQLTFTEILPIIGAAMDVGYSIEWTEDGGLKGWKK